MKQDGKKRPPQRSCLICRQKRDKGELKRFVLDGEVRLEDAKQRLPGRGYYVCAEGACLEQWQRRPLRKKKVRARSVGQAQGEKAPDK